MVCQVRHDGDAHGGAAPSAARLRVRAARRQGVLAAHGAAALGALPRAAVPRRRGRGRRRRPRRT